MAINRHAPRAVQIAAVLLCLAAVLALCLAVSRYIERLGREDEPSIARVAPSPALKSSVSAGDSAPAAPATAAVSEADTEPEDESNAADGANALLDQWAEGQGVGLVSAETLKKEVEAIGKLKNRRDVPIGFMTRGKLRLHLRKLFDDEYPPESSTLDERMLRAFGLIEPDIDLRSLILKYMHENVGGFYDPKPSEKRLYAVSGTSTLGLSNQIVLAHELRHAIQDQFIDLHEGIPRTGEYDDRHLAMLSLIEGDATLLMTRYMNRVMGWGDMMHPVGGDEETFEEIGMPFEGLDADLMDLFQSPEIQKAPRVIKEKSMAPYTLGLTFATAIHRRGGYDLINEKLKSPPLSMEQVLHPSKYLVERDDPVPVATGALPAGAAYATEGRLGEFLIRILLASGLDEPSARKAAAGWGGDAWVLYRDAQGRDGLIWKTVWDTEEEAREFRAALVAMALVRYGKVDASAGRRGVIVLRDAHGAVTRISASRGNEVVMERTGLWKKGA